MRLGLFLIGLLVSVPTWSFDSDLTLQQLNHKGWTAASGAPSYVQALAQTADGMLWLGSEMGLFRFDGMQFVRYTGPPGQEFASTNISALSSWPDSGLWIGFRFGGMSVLRGNRLVRYGERDGVPAGTIKSIVRDRDGRMWVAARAGLALLQGDHWEKVSIRPDVDSEAIMAALGDNAGTLWVLTASHLFARPPHGSAFQEIESFSDATTRAENIPLATAPDGKLWASVEDTGLVRATSPTKPNPVSTVVFPGLKQGALMFDRGGSLWVANDNVQRLPTRVQVADPGAASARQAFETFTQSDGLTGPPNSFFEDREGNIWVGTGGGIDRFSDSSVVKVPMPAGATLPGLMAGEAGTVWVAYAKGYYAGAVAQIHADVVSPALYDGSFTCSYRDPDGSFWFGGRDGILHIEGTRHSIVLITEQAERGELQAITRDGSGGLWISVVGKGVYRLSDGEWTHYGNLAALPRATAIVMTTDEEGVVWLGYTDNRVARVAGSSVTLLGTGDGLSVGNVTAIQRRGAHIWIGGELGLAHFDGKRVSTILGPTGNALTGISGILATANGDLWLNGNTGISHIIRPELEQAAHDPAFRVHPEVFNYLDGLPATAAQLRPLPSAIEGTDGRLWFAQETSAVWIDPARIHHNPLPPPVTIWSVISGAGHHYPVSSDVLHLPVRTTSLQIQFSAGSLSIPERVAFRYKLEGSDEDWQDAGNRHVAFYTNLAPGQYTFRVIAANNDDVWNNTGAAVELVIRPTFYQTPWFAIVCALLCLAVLHTLHRLRLRQARRQVRARLEERVAERERIARELHDTLLQSIQGLILRFHAIAERIAPRESAREQLDKALQRAEEVLTEGRNRVKDLRMSGSVVELSRSLAAVGDQLAQEHSSHFRASVEGALRELHPIVREEALLIANEALTNAFRHAQARNVEVEVSYGSHELHVRVRDDGIGIDPSLLNAGGRPGHWGMLGMRERANKIRASLNIWSKPNAGTEIDLSVPADVAYRGKKRR